MNEQQADAIAREMLCTEYVSEGSLGSFSNLSLNVKIEVISQAILAADRDARDVGFLPWRHGNLDGWRIVGMNHYTSCNVRHIFIAMTNGDRCIKAEGLDTTDIWEQLNQQAAAIRKQDDDSTR